MNKKLKIFLVLLLLIVLVFSLTYSYALDTVDQTSDFFSLNKNEFCKNEKVEILIDFTKIEYEKFKFELQSSEIVDDIEISEIGELDVDKSNNEIIIEVDKSKTNLNNIKLYYEIPESKVVGDTIQFVATATNILENITEEVDNEEINQEETSQEEVIDSKTVQVQIKIIEEKLDDEKNDNNKDEKKEQEIPIKDDLDNVDDKILKKDNVDKDEKNKMDFMISKEKDMLKDKLSISTNNTALLTSDVQTENVVYNGSNNNYLNKLSVENYEFTKKFVKENTTYFVTVDNTVSKINISASSEDDTAKICVYGNDNLEVGTNKVLLSVTAENGNVRNYRIYVIKNA